MTVRRYLVMARYWNLDRWEYTYKDCKTKSAALGAMKVLIDNTTPYQVSYTDREAEQPPEGRG